MIFERKMSRIIKGIVKLLFSYSFDLSVLLFLSYRIIVLES